MNKKYKKPLEVISELELNFFEFDESNFEIKPKTHYSKHIKKIATSDKRVTKEFTDICLTLTSNGLKYFIDQSGHIHLEQFIIEE